MGAFPQHPTRDQAIAFLRDVATKRKRTTTDPIERAATVLGVTSEHVRITLTRGRMAGGYMSGARRIGPGGSYEPRTSSDLSGAGDAARILQAAGVPLEPAPAQAGTGNAEGSRLEARDDMTNPTGA